MRLGVVIFPGSNCDRDALAAAEIAGYEAVPLWHGESAVEGVDAIILPGGFSYGDALRAGALAATAPVMAGVRRFAARGGAVLGICNGFQILCEAGLLPGALTRNRDLAFHCHDVALTVVTARTPWTRALAPGERLVLPVAHGEGRYVVPPEELDRLEAQDQIVFRYEDNFNGSCGAVAGVCNRAGNVVGMMPHPERRVEAVLGGEAGLGVFRSLRLAAAGVTRP
ncbi:MAG: phosphoribosylformylglycinamidine synthase subunit PurQ [Firmicutes bacterium]|nr:phosphoribosylformylglycinamidine synthase subunit PurQ [Bacillota bacterium]